jgi:hypothetical protein
MNSPILSVFLILLWTFLCFGEGLAKTPATTFTQGDGAAKPAGKVLSLPADTVIFAKLAATLDTAQCTQGERIEAEITHDVKVGHDTVLKRGGRVIGHVAGAAKLDANGMHGFWIVFDTVAAKNADPMTLHADIQAVSPPETSGADAGILFPVAADRSTTEGPHGELTAESKGAIRLPGVTLATRDADGVQVTGLASKSDNIHLVKGSQLVFRVVNP